MSAQPRIAAALIALTLFLLGLAGVWRLARPRELSIRSLPPMRAPAIQAPQVATSPPLPPPAAPSVVVVPAPVAPPVADQRSAGLTLPRPMAQANGAAPAAAVASAGDIAAVRIALDQVGLMFRDYRTRMGGNPEGTNAEIMRAVMGGNPKGARLGPPEGQNLNARGELVDRWGTAYFFHQMSASHMEIHSAGT